MLKPGDYVAEAGHIILDTGGVSAELRSSIIMRAQLLEDKLCNAVLARTHDPDAEVDEIEYMIEREEWRDEVREMISNNEIINKYVYSKGILTATNAYTACLEAASRPNPKQLWGSLWYEGEVCCLFADSNVGKSIYAVQMAIEIAKRNKVLYFDFELSDKQFQMRYTDDNENVYKFPANLVRVEINRDLPNIDFNLPFEDIIIRDIESMAADTKANILIIDNLTYLCSASEKGDLAGVLMQRLMGLKRTYDLSIMVIAHTPKRSLISPITQNDLAGSKKLFNFFDSVFAIGKSVIDDNIRYIKQLKVRSGAFEYGENNVAVNTIEMIDGFLQFVPMGHSSEREHLREPTVESDKELREKALELHNGGGSIREIAKQLGCSVGKAHRLVS